MESLPALFAPGEQARALRALRPIITLAPMRIVHTHRAEVMLLDRTIQFQPLPARFIDSGRATRADAQAERSSGSLRPGSS